MHRPLHPDASDDRPGAAGRTARRTVVVIILIVATSVALVTIGAGAAPRPGPGTNDADVVIVLPDTSRATFRRERDALGPFVKSLRSQRRPQRLKVAFVPLSRILHGLGPEAITPNLLRDYLRSRFTWRASTEAQPRYLGIFAAPSAGYLGTPSTLPVIPRFIVDTGTTTFPTDLPYEFLSPDRIDGGDGHVDPGDLDVTAPTFEVFRVPTTTLADFTRFSDRHAAFATAPYRSDATLVAGEYGMFNGDTSVVQCLNAANIGPTELATQVLKVFDSTAAQCQPDVFTTPSGPTLADVLADPNGAFHGGTIVDVSHGGSSAIFAGYGFFVNLSVGDVARIPADRLNVFISIACDNDAPDSAPNLAAAMYAQASVAVVSATTVVGFVNVSDALFAEVDSVSGLWQNHETLLQRLHVFRSEYYTRFVQTAATAGDREQLWGNVLTETLIGDGLVTLAR